MIVKARLAVVHDGTPLVAEGEVEIKDGARLKAFFKKADQALGFGKTRPFRQALKGRPAPNVLINGDRVDLPEDLNKKLEPGDEVTVLTPLMGG